MPPAAIAARKTDKPMISLANFIQRLQDFKVDPKRLDVYRGHADRAYKITPSLFRDANQKHEKNILRELLSLHPTDFSDDRSVFEHLVRMQHFSLPTRLLDVTYNPLVALYFACVDNKRYDESDRDGEFIRFSVQKPQVRYFDSDTVSCVANLSNLTPTEMDELLPITSPADLEASHSGKRLLQFIKSEKPYFLPEIRPTDLASVHLVKPKQNNRRILAQQGAFFIFGLVNHLEDSNNLDIKIVRNVIPAGAKQGIIEGLDKINITPSSLFPELEFAAKYIMSKLTPVGDSET